MIRKIEFTVNENAVTPNARQFAGVAGEHNATQLSFTIEMALLKKIQQQADDSKELKYRFDCFDSCGALYSTESAPFTEETVTLPLGENITRLGGEAKIVLVVTLLNAESKTEMELLSVPVSVYFKGVPFASGKLDESRESLTAIEQSAKNAARNAEGSAENAERNANAATNFASNAASSAFASQTSANSADESADKAQKSAEDAAGYAGEAKKALEDANTAATDAKNQKFEAERMLITHNTDPEAHGLQNAVFKDEYGDVNLEQANVFAGMFRAMMGAFDTLQTPNEETGEFENVVTISRFLKAIAYKMNKFGELDSTSETENVIHLDKPIIIKVPSESEDEEYYFKLSANGIELISPFDYLTMKDGVITLGCNDLIRLYGAMGIELEPGEKGIKLTGDNNRIFGLDNPLEEAVDGIVSEEELATQAVNKGYVDEGLNQTETKLASAITEAFERETVTGSMIELADVVKDTFVDITAQKSATKVFAVGKNLFEQNEVEVTFHNTIILPNSLPAGEYRIGAEIELGEGNTNTTCLVGIKSGTTTLTNVALKVSNETKLRNSVYINASQPFDRITLYAGSNASTAKGQTATFKNIHLEFGNGTAEYEPYCGAFYDLKDNVVRLIAQCSPLYLLTDDLSVFQATYCKGKTAIDGVNTYYFANNYLPGKVDTINELMKSAAANGDAFIFITDQHLEQNRNAGQSPALIKYICDNTKVNKLFSGGDVKVGSKAEYAELMSKSFSGEIHYVIGNHEYDVTETDEILFYEYDINKNEQIGNSQRHYYYVDNPQQEMRYVVLNPFAADGSGNQSGWDEEQNEWLKNAALNVESGWGIIIIMHYMWSLGWKDDIQSAIDDYSGAGEIIAVFNGHLHHDEIKYTAGGTPCIGVTCDKYYSTNDTLMNVERTPGEISEQAFDVVIVDRTARKLHCVRIGAQAVAGDGTDTNNLVEIRTVDFKAVTAST